MSGQQSRVGTATMSKPSNGQKINVSLTGLAETALLTHGARAVDAVRPVSILGDTWAKEAQDQIDYPPPAQEEFIISTALRSQLMDVWTAEFLGAHPKATVLHLGCGLDSRALRLSWGLSVRWIDVDLPDVVELRRRVIPRPVGDYRLVAASILENKWLGDIPTDRPTLVIMEGLLPYLDQAQIEDLLKRLCARFPRGRMILDTVGKVFVRLQTMHSQASDTAALARFGIDSPQEVEDMNPGLKLEKAVQVWELPGIALTHAVTRFVMWIYSWLPGFKTYMSYYQFDWGS